MKTKSKRKIKVAFSMCPDLYHLFENHIDEKLLDRSKVIEKLIEEYMKNK